MEMKLTLKLHRQAIERKAFRDANQESSFYVMSSLQILWKVCNTIHLTQSTYESNQLACQKVDFLDETRNKKAFCFLIASFTYLED